MPERDPINADDVARKSFATTFRGYDQYEVRAYLGQVAAELGALYERERFLRDRLEGAESRAVPAVLGEAELAAALGHETARVLQAAHESAAEVRSRAEEETARLRSESLEDATRMRAEAEELLHSRAAETEALGATVRADAEAAAAELRAEAERQARAVVEEAQNRGREMVGEAQAVRERVLRDLARRRRAAHQQLEQLRAGRERLLDTYRVVRSNLDEATAELTVADSEARVAGEAASLRAFDVPEATLEEMEAEVSTGRGQPDVDLPAEESGAPDRPAGDEIVVETAPAEEPVLVGASVAGSPEAKSPGAGTEAPAATPAPAVDELFARMRSDRAAAVAEAKVVLSNGDADRDAGGGPTPEPESGAPTAPAAGEPESTEVDPAVSADEEALAERDAETEPIERALAKALKRALADEQNEVLDSLRRLRTAPSLDELLPSADAHRRRFVTAARSGLEQAGMLGLGGGSGSGSAPPIDDVAESLAEDITVALRSRVATSVEEAEGDEAVLAQGVSASYREWKMTRVEPMARHAVVAAHARGRFAVVEGPLRWVVDDEQGACPDCDDNALAGPIDKGQVFPTGQPHPPAHPGCRCLVRSSNQ